MKQAIAPLSQWPRPSQAGYSQPVSQGNFFESAQPIGRNVLQRNLSTNLFFLVISPPPDAIEYIFYLKRQIQQAIGHSYESAFSIAHISLYQYHDFHNESLLYIFKERAARIKPFKVFIKDFNVFRNNGTIYADVVNKNGISDLAEQVTGESITPHITIAKNLNEEELQIARQILKNIPYSYFFECKTITVLKWNQNKWNHHLDLSLAQTFNCYQFLDNLRSQPRPVPSQVENE